MKILAVTFDSEYAGGANRSFLMVLKNLREQFGHEIYVIVPNHGPLEEELQKNRFSYELLPLNMKLVRLNGSPKDILRKIKANWIASDHFLKAKINKKRFLKENFDVVYVNCANQLFGGFLARNLKLPCVWHFRGRFDKEMYYVYNQKELFGGGKNQIIVISRQMYDTVPILSGVPKKKFHMIHNGLEYPVRSLPGYREGTETHAVICGRICRYKGQLEAIEAVRLLRQDGYEIYLHIAGSLKAAVPGYLKALEQKIETDGLNQYVVFEDQVSDMAAFRENMHIELMCSECEPFGRVTVEGMRSGLVVIGANTGGTVDIIEDGITGLLYEQGNAKDLAEKIKTVIGDRYFADSLIKNAVNFSGTHFTVAENIVKIHKVLEEAVEDPA